MFEIICDPCNLKRGIFISKSILSSVDLSHPNCSGEGLVREFLFIYLSCNYNGIWRSHGKPAKSLAYILIISEGNL